jgi:hypothetical protein
VAFVFVLALMVDAACAAACVPAELQTPSKHCATSDQGHKNDCDLHAHLKPAVRNGSAVAPSPADDAPSRLEDAAISNALESFGPTVDGDAILHVPPLFQQNSVLRI